MRYFIIALLVIPLHFAYSYQYAIVNSDQAIIYADREQTISIGKIKRGTRILVGEKLRGRGKVLPLITHNKIAYIAINNLFIEKELDKIKEYCLQTRKTKRERQTAQQEKCDFIAKDFIRRFEQDIYGDFYHSISFRLGKYYVGSDWQTFSKKIQNLEDQSFGTHLAFRSENIIPDTKLHTTIGLDYWAITDYALQMKALGIGGGLSIFISKYNRFSLKGIAEITLCPWTRLQISGENLSGQLAGFNFGFNLSYKITKSLMAQISPRINYLQLLNIDDSNNGLVNKDEQNLTMWGPSLFAAVSFPL